MPSNFKPQFTGAGTTRPRHSNLLGHLSLGVFLLQILAFIIGLVVAHNAGPGGHPPAGGIIAGLLYTGILFAAPLGLVLGAIALRKPPRAAAWTGIAGNLLLLVPLVILLITMR